MKRALIGLALAAVLAISVPATAGLTTITAPAGTVTSGWNLLALPGIPVNPDPQSVLAGFDLDGKLQRWDAASQSLCIYDPWGPEAFGNMLLTDGYWLQTETAGNVSFTGLNDNDTMDVWISLPKAGWSLIGNPFSHDFNWDNAKVVDGNVTVSMFDAAKTNGWMNSVGMWWDSETQGLMDFGITEDFPWTTTMLPWHGYWVESYVDKIALVLESS